MKTTDFIVENEFIGDDAHAMHKDHEVSMAKADCYHAAKSAIQLHKILKTISERDGIDAWVFEKLTLANDYLSTALEYLEYHLKDQPQELEVFNGELAESKFNELMNQPVDESFGFDDFEVDGYHYQPWEETDGDTRKIFHTVIAPDGQELSVDWGSRRLMKPQDLKLWIELGMPKRISRGPLTREDLITIKNQQSSGESVAEARDPRYSMAEDSFNQNFNQIDSIITKKYPKEIMNLLLGMFPTAKKAIVNQYNDEDGMPFAEWRRVIWDIGNYVLSGPVVVNGSKLPIDPETEADRLAKYQQYIKDKDSGKPARYFRANDSDPRTINFTKLPPITIAQTDAGMSVTDGNHRAFLAKMANKPLRAYVWEQQPNNHPNVAKIKALFSDEQGVAEDSVEEGWKGALAGAALAGLGALSGAPAQAADLSNFNTQYLQQVASGEHPRPMVSIDDAKQELQARANGKQQAVPARPAQSQASAGYSKEWLQKAADPNRTGRYMISVGKAQELLGNMQEGVAEGAEQNYLSQIPNLIWKPVSRSIWNTIQDEGLDEEQDAPKHTDWVMASLTIDPKDAQALQAFDSDAIEDFNRFDIHLKSRYTGLTDLIDYDNGTVTIVKPIQMQGVAEGSLNEFAPSPGFNKGAAIQRSGR
jgi:hypothetical protein